MAGWLKGTIAGVFLVAVIAGLVVLFSWPTWQQNWKLDEIDAATDEATALRLADEYIVLAKADPNRIDATVRDRRGSLAVQIHLATSVEDQNGKLVPLLVDIAQRLDHEIDDAGRVLALRAAIEHWGREHADLVRAEESTWIEWATQTDRHQVGDEPDDPASRQRHTELAIAAIDLIALRGGEYNGDRASRIYRQIINDPSQHVEVSRAAVRALPHVIDELTVGDGLDLIVGANRDLVLDDSVYRGGQTLVAAITEDITPGYLGQVLDLLDSDSDSVQSAAVAFLQGAKMRSIDPRQREDVGRRIGTYLTADVLRDRPLVFREAVRAVGSLKLTGASDALIEMYGDLEGGSELADLASNSVSQLIAHVAEDGANQDIAAADRIFAALARALDDADARGTAAATLTKIKGIQGNQFINLRACLEFAVAGAIDEPLCMEAVEHIAADLFGASDAVQRLSRPEPAEQVNAWATFLAEDRPNFQKFIDGENFLERYSTTHQRAGDFADQDEWQAVKDELIAIRQGLGPWMEDPPAAYPLGMSSSRAGKLNKALGEYFVTLKNAYSAR